MAYPAGAAQELFDEELSKDAREEMAGLSMEEIQSNQTFINYALRTRACLRVYQNSMPALKRRLPNIVDPPDRIPWTAIDGPLCRSSSIR